MKRLRWAVALGAWEPAAPEFDFLLGLLPEEERAPVLRFRQEADKRRALVSRLLQRAAAATALGLPHAEVVVRRTRGSKPYAANALDKPHAPNWNYSVSHEGEYVVLAAEPVCICGCDVAAPRTARPRRPGQPPEPLDAFFRSFEQQFTAREWEAIRGAGSEAEQEGMFRKLWSLKEAFVKATGEGLGFELGLIHFEVSGSTATASVRGEAAEGWAFHLHELGQGHWVAVARAPLSAVVDAWGGFKATFQRTDFAPGEWQEQLHAPEPPFTMLSVADLVPPDQRAAYAAAGGELLTCVDQSSVEVIEQFGKFSRIAYPGFNYVFCCIGERVAGGLSLRIQQLDVRCETKTKDNVFVDVVVSVQYQVVRESLYDAFYKLTDSRSQITSYVFDEVRATVPRMALDDVFTAKEDIARNVKEELQKSMSTFGFQIINVLVTDIEPAAKVKAAMNEINAAQRLRLAAYEQSEADKVRIVKAAEADAEAKYLAGQGIARQRQAIIAGLRESVQTFQSEVSDVNSRDVMELLLITQYFDTLKDIGLSGKSNTVFMQHSPGSVGEVSSQIRNGFMQAMASVHDAPTAAAGPSIMRR